MGNEASKAGWTTERPRAGRAQLTPTERSRKGITTYTFFDLRNHTPLQRSANHLYKTHQDINELVDEHS